jgi:plastocyanin
MKLFMTSVACLLAISAYSQTSPCDQEDAILVQTFAYGYTPQELTIEVGQTVAWLNIQGFHDVNGDVNSITNELFNNPESFYIPPVSASSESHECIGSHVFTIPGIYFYDCSTGNHAQKGMVGTIIVNEPQTIVNELEALSVLIYPNPVSNSLTINLSDLTGVDTTIKLYDSSGKQVFEKKSSSTLQVDVSAYAKGLYTLELSNSDKVLRTQVVVE